MLICMCDYDEEGFVTRISIWEEDGWGEGEDLLVCDFNLLLGSEAYIVKTAKLFCDAANNSPPGLPEEIANARLIDAAPDLLAACESFIEQDTGRLLFGPMFHDEVCAAIAKARGEA